MAKTDRAARAPAARQGKAGRPWWAALLFVPAACLAQALPQPAEPLPLETVVASRGGVSVTMEDLDARLAQMPAEVRPGYMNDPQRIEVLLLNMLLEKQLAALGRKEGLDQRRLFDAQARQVVDRLLGSQAIDHHVANLPEPDFEQLARERYMADTKAFSTPEQLDLTQILVKATDRTPEEARARAEEARRKALDGVPFEELIAEYNEGKPASGRLQGVVRGQTVQPFEEAAFALQEEGDISPVIESRFGFHVVRLDRRTAATRAPFDAVKETLVEKLRKEWRNSESALLRDKLNSMPIEAEPDVVASLRTRYLPDNTPLKDYADTASATE